jgi:transposase
MANQLKMANILAIQALHAQGWSQRAIARQLGINRETVARYVRPPVSASNPAKMNAGPGASLEDPTQLSEPASPLPPTRAVRPRGSDRWWETIEARRLPGLSAQRFHQDLVREHGFTQSYASVQRYVRLVEAQQPLIEDGKRRKTHVLRIVLSHTARSSMSMSSIEKCRNRNA